LRLGNDDSHHELHKSDLALEISCKGPHFLTCKNSRSGFKISGAMLALDVLVSRQGDLVLSDQLMPGLTGTELAAR
jgi:CheY-like chemotaxis protein